MSRERAPRGVAAAPPLDPQEIARYSRHLIMPEVGLEGQRRLREARVLLIGAGGLGSPLGLYLAAAGVGRIGIVDHDRVELSNLQRQVMHGTSTVGRSKLASAVDRLRDLNPGVEVLPFEARLDSGNALPILGGFDLVVDGSDNFPTRYLVNDAAVLLGKPNVYGSIFRFEGQASVFWASRGPCYRCLYPEPPPPGLVPSCAEGGVLGILPGIVGAIQATEAIKLILGKGEPLVGRLLLFDALAMRFRELRLRKDPDCPVCGERPTIRELIDYDRFCGLPAAAGPSELDIEPGDLNRRLERGEDLVVLDVRSAPEWELCHLPGSLNLPLAELPARASQLDSRREYVVCCKSGPRSLRAVEFLRQAGFRRLHNLRGGLDAWAREVDPTLVRY